MSTRTDLTGLRFGRLTVTEQAARAPGFGRFWLCRCDCGIVCIRRTSSLRDKARSNQSCGCAVKDSIARASAAAWKATTKFQHPHKLKLKWLYRNMVNRCHKPGTRRYERYGGRGIYVCAEWRTNPTAFFQWAVAAGYDPSLSIERIDRDGNYCPENCRFASRIEQANNTSRNRFVTRDGKTQTVSQWARDIGTTPKALQHRLDRGWDIDRALSQPFRGA